jgi:large exoprotein involved in heme utilization and adhesion
VPGAIVIDGGGPDGVFTGISSRAVGIPGWAHLTGKAGNVTVSAGSLTIRNGGQISSATTGTGQGGNIRVTAGLGILLIGQGGNVRATARFGSAWATDPQSQITAASIWTGDAGSITVSAPRLSLRDGAKISTEALSANGGDITIGLGDMLHLQRSSITTSVNGALGTGGNITIDPRFVVLDHSRIEANAMGGSGGNVNVLGQLLQPAGSAITATSNIGTPGRITLSGQPVNLTGSLVVLASELRAVTAVLQESCAPQGARPRSSLVVAGRGGQRHAPETTLPALYIANRPVRTGQADALEVPTPPLHTSVTLSTRCG